jgi:PAS domain-containing protein
VSPRSLKQSLSSFMFGVASNLDDLDEQSRRRIRAAQIDAVVQLVPLTMTINLFNAAIVAYVFWDTGTNLFLTVWGALVAAAAAAGFWSWNRTRRNQPTGASARATRRFVLHAAFLGAIWGAAPLALFPGANLLNQLILCGLIVGMISGGAFCLSTVPKAGLAYTWIIVLAMEAAFLLADYQTFYFAALLLLLYAVFISRHLVAHGALLVRHLRDELKLEAQRELIGLLLNDFEEHASDWLWETDASGVLMRISDRFAEAAGKTPAEIQGARFSDVLRFATW